MKNNGPCADIAGSAGEGLRKTKEEHMSWSAWIAVAIAVLEVIREESD